MSTRNEVAESAARRRILDAAAGVFAERGYGGTSTRDIAAAAGRSPAAVYVHYPSKEELLYAISAQGHADSLLCLTAAYNSTPDPVARLHGMVLAFSRWHMTNARIARIVQYELHALSPAHREHIARQRRQFHGVMKRALTDGIAAGVMTASDTDGVTRVLLSLCIDLARWFDPARTRNPEAIARLNADVALRIAGARP